jgi:hypothetical protein
VTAIVLGVLADALGAASQLVTVPANSPGRNFDVRRQLSSVPSIEYRSVQPAAISVDVDHDRRIGAVKYLELSQGGRLHAVCEIDASCLDEGP